MSFASFFADLPSWQQLGIYAFVITIAGRLAWVLPDHLLGLIFGGKRRGQ